MSKATATCHMRNVLWEYAVDPQSEREEAVRLVRLALSIDDGESGIELADRAVALNPKSSWAWITRGLVCWVAGQPEEVDGVPNRSPASSSERNRRSTHGPSRYSRSRLNGPALQRCSELRPIGWSHTVSP